MSFEVSTSPSFSSLQGQSGNQGARKLGTGLLANALLLALVVWVKVPSSDRPLLTPRIQLLSLSRLPEASRFPESIKPTLAPLKRHAPKARLVETLSPETTRNLELPAPPGITPAKVELNAVLPSIEAPSRLAPKPVVGSFASIPPSVARDDRKSVGVAIGGFGSSAARLDQRPNPTLVEAGSFGGEESRTASKPGTRVGLAQESGFENSDALSQSPGRQAKARMAVVQGAAFGGSGPSLPRVRSSATMMASSFDASPASSKRNRLEREATAETEFKGVEILSKPRPLYTEEARRLGIEGEVQLRILFGADGRLKVLALVRGLGHGLDENAALAAAQIQFRPASKQGQAVEQAAVVRVQFQLAN